MNDKDMDTKFKLIKTVNTLKGTISLVYDGFLAIVMLNGQPVNSSSNLTEMYGFFAGVFFCLNTLTLNNTK